jgi:hypothetical protein
VQDLAVMDEFDGQQDLEKPVEDEFFGKLFFFVFFPFYVKGNVPLCK